MISNVLQMGNKLELVMINRDNSAKIKQGIFSGEEKVYLSVIYDIPNEEEILANIPQDHGKLILIPKGIEVFMICYGKNGLYSCNVRVKERFKASNAFLMQLEIISPVTKYQRRDYFRWNCMIDLDFRLLSANTRLEEINNDNMDYYIKQATSGNIESGTILDISGGGIRFSSKKKYEDGSLILMTFIIKNEFVFSQPVLLGRLLQCYYNENTKLYENRVQFQEISKQDRELIVKYIFEEERRTRNSMKG
ncbi:MAG: PilZ domain-containing protein [Eubacterium sp.]|nr:PilZ domain-containing protein [Eubacterium sp.]